MGEGCRRMSWELLQHTFVFRCIICIIVVLVLMSVFIDTHTYIWKVFWMWDFLFEWIRILSWDRFHFPNRNHTENMAGWVQSFGKSISRWGWSDDLNLTTTWNLRLPVMRKTIYNIILLYYIIPHDTYIHMYNMYLLVHPNFKG